MRENAMQKTLLRSLCLTAIVCALPMSARAAINGLKTNARVFNDYGTSSLTISNSNTIPGTVSIDDRNMTNATNSGANRHDILLSEDGGATAATLPITQGFTIQGTFNLTDLNNSPRKEAGIRINSPVTGDALFIINSDAGEIVAFGGGAPFYNFRSAPFSEPAYVPGQTITLGETYRPGVGGNPGTTEYFINRGSGIESSGQLAWSNLEGGPLNYQVGVYLQGGSNGNANDFMNLSVTNLSGSLVVPEPASIGLVAFSGLALLARRRNAKRA